MSELVTNKITPSTGSSDTVTLGDSSDTFQVPSGVTLNVASGATISNSGTATGFGADTDLSNLSAATGYSKIAQAWARVDQVAGAAVLNDSLGVSSVADISTGRFYVNFSSAMTSDYYVSAGCAATAASPHNRSVGAVFETTSQAQVYVWRDHDNTLYDMNQVSIIFFCGDA